MTEIAKLSSKYQISIRKAMRWQAGQKFAFIPKGSGVLLVPVPEKEQLKGLAKGANPENCRDHGDRA